MSDELNTVLRLVAEGALSPEEAAPIIEALSGPARRTPGPHDGQHGAHAEAHAERREGRGRRVHIQVSERGRRVVDVRVPLAFAAFAARAVPGLPERYAALIEQAVAGESIGAIVDTEDEDGDRVVISVE